MFLIYDYCHNSESDALDSIINRVTWGDELIVTATHESGQAFQVTTPNSTYTYIAPECDFHGHYPALFPFGPEYLAVLFTMALTPLALAWVMTAIRRLL